LDNSEQTKHTNGWHETPQNVMFCYISEEGRIEWMGHTVSCMG